MSENLRFCHLQYIFSKTVQDFSGIDELNLATHPDMFVPEEIALSMASQSRQIPRHLRRHTDQSYQTAMYGASSSINGLRPLTAKICYQSNLSRLTQRIPNKYSKSRIKQKTIEDVVIPYEHDDDPDVPKLTTLSRRVIKSRSKLKRSAFQKFNIDIVEGRVSNVADKHKRISSAAFKTRTSYSKQKPSTSYSSTRDRLTSASKIARQSRIYEKNLKRSIKLKNT